jgi:hypothetical protein
MTTKIQPYENFYFDLKNLYGNNIVIYGPYIRKSDSRAIAQVCYYEEGKKVSITKLYAKFKLEISLKRILTKEETVDHIDNNPLNDEFYNLRILSRKENASYSVKRRVLPEAACVFCSKKFTLSVSQVSKRSEDTAGPFCSKQCTGKYGSLIQNLKIKVLARVLPNLTYYKNSDL